MLILAYPMPTMLQVALDYGVYAAEDADPGYLLTLSLPGEDEDKCYYDKVDIVEQEGLREAETFTLRSGEAPSERMLAFLRLMNIGGAPGSHCSKLRCCTLARLDLAGAMGQRLLR